MSVLSFLGQLSSDLNVAENESASIEKSVIVIHSRLGAYFESEVKERIRFGSSTRRTMLPRAADPASDVDYMVVFDNSYSYKPQTFISKLKRFAEKYYSLSEVYQSSPTVVLELNHIKFDLVPAYRSWGQVYIPAPSSSFLEWMHTDPLSLNSELDRANASANYHLRPLIMILKYWNARNNYIFESFDLEGRITRMSFLLCRNLKEGLYSAMETLYWGRSVLPQYKQQKVERAKEIIDSAKFYEDQNMPATAEAEIKKLLPPL